VRLRSKLPDLIRRRVLQLGLAQRATAVVSVGFLVLFVSISVIAERALQVSSARLLEERLTIAELAASQIDRILLRAIVELDQVQRSVDFNPEGDLEAQSAALADAYRWLSTFSDGISLVDPSGRVVVSQPQGRRPPVLPFVPVRLVPAADGYAEPSAVAPSSGAASDSGAHLSAPFLDAESNRPMVAVYASIQREGQLLGILNGNVALDGKDIRDTLREAASLSETGHALLIDGEGRTLVATMTVRLLAPSEHPTFYRRVLADGVAAEESVPVEAGASKVGRKHRHVMAVVPLHVAPWAVAVGADEEEIFAGVSRLRLDLALVGAVALLAAWAMTLVGTRRLVRPVQRLTESAERIAAGDLDTPLEASEGGEIGAMASALDTMRQQLLRSITELAGWNEALEGRVEDRTHALRQQQALTQRLVQRVITAQEEERGRLSRDLHDEIGQSLTGVQLSIDRAAKSLVADDPVAAQRLYDSRALVDQALKDLRHMIADLRPGVLDQLGLVPALRWVADNTLRPNGIAITVEVEGLDRRLPQVIETILFRIGQEAMSNVVRHSGAKHVAVRIVRHSAKVRMTLKDDGRGFDPAAVAGSPDPQRGLGLAGMSERASAAGGRVTVVSAPGKGTSVRVAVPVADDAVTPDVESERVRRRPTDGAGLDGT